MTTAVADRPVAATTTRTRRKRRTSGVLLGLLAWVIGVIFIIPVLWMVLTSFHSEADAGTNPPSINAPLTLDGYRDFFGSSTGTNPWPYLANSATASVSSTIIVLLLALPASPEAAAIDGAGVVYTMRKIITPIAVPGIASTALICFIFSWNELLFARVLTGVTAQTAPVFLTSFVTSQGLFLAKVCAAATVVSIPVVVAGFAAQDKLVQGLSLGAVK